MGVYYNPPNGVRTAGRAIPIEGSYPTLASQLKEDEALFGLYQRHDVPWKNAPQLFDAREFEEFEGQVREGIISRIGYYAVPRAQAEKVCGPLREQKR